MNAFANILKLSDFTLKITIVYLQLYFSGPLKMAPAIPKDSIVLVTGVNGFIGSHVADLLMEAGYRVRGTTRHVSKVQELSALWKQKFGEGKFEVFTVENMAKEGAFDEAIKGIINIRKEKSLS